MLLETLELPPSASTVRVRMIDTTGMIVSNANTLIKPVQPGHELMNIPVAAFLVEHLSSGKKVMFDVGIRKDYWNLPPILQKRLGEVISSLRVDEDVPELLQKNGISLHEISTVIWSHYHWDHIGNTAMFPNTTELVVGPGFKADPNLLPGYPHVTNSPVDAGIFNSRHLREIDFSQTSLFIGGYPAHDFFGDGSFYLLDTPGHCLGHMCGLARTTPDPKSTFLLLGGDICHFPGVFRPSPAVPLPDPIPRGVLDNDIYFPAICPCSVFTENHPRKLALADEQRRATPFYLVPTDPPTAYVDPIASQRSVDGLLAFDSHPRVMILLAHDRTALQMLPLLNNAPDDDLNSWKERGYKDKVRWGWLNDLPRDGTPGRRPIVEGFWRDKQPWTAARTELRQNGEAGLSGRLET